MKKGLSYHFRFYLIFSIFTLTLSGCGGGAGALTPGPFWQLSQTQQSCSSSNPQVLQAQEALNLGDYAAARAGFASAARATPEDACAAFGYALTNIFPDLYQIYTQLPYRSGGVSGTPGVRLNPATVFTAPDFEESLLYAPAGFITQVSRYWTGKAPLQTQALANQALALALQAETALQRAGQDGSFYFFLSSAGYRELLANYGVTEPANFNFSAARFNNLNAALMQSLLGYETAWLYLGSAYSETGLEAGELYGRRDLDGDGKITLSLREDLPPAPALLLNPPDSYTLKSGREKLAAARLELMRSCEAIIEVLDSLNYNMSTGGFEFPCAASPLDSAVIVKWQDYCRQFRFSLGGVTQLTYYYSPDFSMSVWVDLAAFFTNAPDDLTAWLPTLEAGSGRILSWPDATLGGTFPNGIP